MTLNYQPSTCLIVDRDIGTAGIQDLHGLRWHGWGTAAARGRGYRHGTGVSVRADQIHYCGHSFYARVRAGSTTLWIAPGCEYTSRQGQFADAIRTTIASPSGETIASNHCALAAGWKWRCSATAHWSQNNGSTGDSSICTAVFRGHFTATADRVVIDNDPGCDER